MNIEVIGTVHSCFKEKFGTPRQANLVTQTQGYIEIAKKWEPQKCLKGFESFSHAWIVFVFHDNKNQGYRPVIHPPRLVKGGVGSLASRSPMRPNPIGLSLVKIERVESPRIYISGLDMIEGTPVLDIKPYLHEYDSVSGSRSGWVDALESQKLTVEFSEEALHHITQLPHLHLKETITAILSSDIRNRNDKQLKNSGKRLGFFFEDLNIVFQTKNEIVTVLRVEDAASIAKPTNPR